MTFSNRQREGALARLLLLGGLLLMLPLSREGAADEASAWAGTPQERFFTSAVRQKYMCETCHTIMEAGGTVGPVLNQVGRRRSEDWIRRWLTNPQAVKPGTKMPTFVFTPAEFEEVVAHLSRMSMPVDRDGILAGPGSLEDKGRALFQGYDCYACHRVGSEGRFVGPDLTWVGTRKTEAWERRWLHDPAAFTPGTFMPNFRLTDGEVEALAAFVHDQQGRRNQESQEWEFNMNFFLANDPDEAGELIFKRLACWSCHGERGVGRVRNPNMAPDAVMPPLRETTVTYTRNALWERLSTRYTPAPLDPAAPPPPFFCPPSAQALTRDEFAQLYAYLKTLAPRKRVWKFKH